ncbi:MAG: hypothetical protein ACU0CA_14130 [Paracoccaceae bacterium]
MNQRTPTKFPAFLRGHLTGLAIETSGGFIDLTTAEAASTLRGGR